MNGGESIVSGVTGTAAQRLDKALAEASGLSRERVKALLGEGRVWLDGKIANSASAKCAAGTKFEVHVPLAVPLAAAAQDIPLAVAYEDAHLIVIDKPAGLVVHPAAGR